MDTTKCELCGRAETLTEHHIIPKKEHGKVKYLKTMSKRDLMGWKMFLCFPCHSQVHALFSEKVLADNYRTIEDLLKEDSIQKWLVFIQKKPSGYKPRFKRHW
jgi:uncharacterized protein YlaI